MSVINARTDSEILECYPIMSQLRTSVREADFVATVRRQFAEGYQLAFIRQREKAAAVAGFRVLNCLAWGRFCNVDDLVTDAKARSNGLGKILLEWICDFARREDCERVEL